MFKKYESISNQNNIRTIDYYKEKGFFDECYWYGTEKIHGTNFSAIVENGNVTYCQRSGIIEGNFMNHLQYVHKIESKLLALGEYAKEPIQVYFEYYGKGIINKGAINYRNDDEKDFVAYDILYLADNKFASFPLNFELLKRFDIPTVQLVNEGNFEEISKFDLNFKSFLAAKNGVDTYAEGIVFKPCKDLRTELGERVVLKFISEQFQENRPVAKEKPVETEVKDYSEYITDMRLGKVAAKVGIIPSEKNKFLQLLIAFTIDIAEEIPSSNEPDIKRQSVNLVKSFFNG